MAEPAIQEAAEWMRSEVQRLRYLDQSVAAANIEKRFGLSLVHTNDGGGVSIDRRILQAFRRLTEGRVVWDSQELCWRLRENQDAKGRRAD